MSSSQFFSFLIIICFSSTCDYSEKTGILKDQQISQIVSLQPHGNWSVTLDSTSSYRVGFIQSFCLPDSCFVGLVQKNTNSLYIYSLEDSSELIHHLSFPREEPDAVDLAAFSVINYDSLLIFGQYGQAVVLYDLRNNARKDFDLREQTSDASFHRPFQVQITQGSPPIVIGNDLLLHCSCITDDYLDALMNGDSPSLFNNARLENKIDLARETYQILPIRFPKTLQDVPPNSYSPMRFRIFDHHHQRLIYSFGSLSELQVIDYPSLQKKDIEAASSYISSIEPFKEGQDQFVYDAATPQYLTMVQDPYRNVFYRIVYHGLPLSEAVQSPSQEKANFSVIILDEELKVIGETLLPKEEYWPMNYFVGSEGLYISTGNKFNNDLKEDSMSFTIFKLKYL